MGLFLRRDKLSPEQRKVVDEGLACGLKRRQVKYYSDPALSPEQMDEIRKALLEGIPGKDLRVMADPRVSVEEMQRIRKIHMMVDELQVGMRQMNRDTARLRKQFIRIRNSQLKP